MKKILRSRKGMSMVEILVAFTVLLLCVSMITTCVVLAGRVQNHALEHRQDLVAVEEGLYSQSTPATVVEEDVTWHFTGDRADFTFDVKVDLEKTTVEDYTFDTVSAAGP